MDPNQRVTNQASIEWKIDDGRAGTALDETGCQEEWPFRVFLTYEIFLDLQVRMSFMTGIDPVVLLCRAYGVICCYRPGFGRY